MASFFPKYRDPFPNLNDTNHRKTSDDDPSYNCFGWAFADAMVLISPQPGYSWPEGVPRNQKLSALTIVAKAYGYEPCENGDIEPGFEKIALFGISEMVDHAARQLENGFWTSKRGIHGDDIEHNTPESITGGAYGPILGFFKRPRSVRP